MAAYTTIDDPEAYFQVQLYAGNGSANNAITLGGDTDMQPDFVWIKNRDATDSHCLFDAVRSATRLISSDSTVADSADADTLDSFASDGFQVDADVKVNTNAENYVSFCWKESATSGFDIVSFTGNSTARTISHSLSAVPHAILMKNISNGSAQWVVYHAGTGNTQALYLNTTAAPTDVVGFFNDTDPTSSVFTVGTDTAVNGNTNTQINYAFAPVQGFSKFGTYKGNGNADGAFIFCGFRPAFVMVKRFNTTGEWGMFDNKRDVDNVATRQLKANATEVEEANGAIDFCANGFKLRETSVFMNGDDDSYVFMAWAEAPLVNSEGVAGNAR